MSLPIHSRSSAPANSTAESASLCDVGRANASVIAQFRAALDWMITHPDWEGGIALAISQLGFKGQRQGISFRQAALSLPLEEKCEAMRHFLKSENIERPKQLDAKMLARLWKETSFRTSSDRIRLSLRGWNTLRSRISVRISKTYTLYKAAQCELYARYAHLADQIARDICKGGSLCEDAAQEGRLGLLHAIDKIDADKAFESYARQWIKRRIQNFAMREQLPVKAPINLISKSLRSDFQPSSDSERKVSQALNNLRNGVVRLDAQPDLELEDKSDLTDDRENAPDQKAIASDENAMLSYALDNLTSKQREVLSLRFGLEGNRGTASLAEVANATGISRQQVFQREKRALKKLAGTLSALDSERGNKVLA